MDIEHSAFGSKGKKGLSIRGLYGLLAPRACSVIVLAALFYTLAVKFFHSWRTGLVNKYFDWILTDISVLLGIGVVLAAVCFRWPRKLVIRTAIVAAAVVCTWSVMNAGWLIRTGTQILPSVLLPLIRSPVNSFSIIAVNLVKMPAAAVILLVPSAIALAFFFCVLARPQPPAYNRKRFLNRIVICLLLILVAILARGIVARRGSAQTASAGLRYNCQLRAVMSLISPGSSRLAKSDLANAKRRIPTFDQMQIPLSSGAQRINHNVVVVILEGVQYRYTSLAPLETQRKKSLTGLAERENNLTPYLVDLAEQGVEFANARSSLTHTTKVLFSLLTGRYPSVSQDLAEAVPALKPYASLATILKRELGFRTAFFQSAKGNFECRPGLVYNLGFDKFWARDNLNDPNAFIGYLGCDEFAMLKPITEWIKTGDRPFLLTILCSVTHDPYEVPDWFATPAKEPIERYRQAIFYTDKFIAALDAELARQNLTDETILCVIGDHGEAFGEHGLFGHERIAFEEVLRIPWTMRAPLLIQPGTRVTEPVSSIDLTPTLLRLLGFETKAGDFDGVDAMGKSKVRSQKSEIRRKESGIEYQESRIENSVLCPLSSVFCSLSDRKLYFSGWMQQSPAGFVKARHKFIYNPGTEAIFAYDLGADPLELHRIELGEQEGRGIADEIITWRKDSIFRLDQQQAGKKMLFDDWLCSWNNRVSSAKYHKKVR